ncbi:MAG: fructose-6-phosphate aldolase [Bdellovibrionaceae bacterium]|jgi:transaldolase|nr:fructose-6-phosphate aldolase [Pseudobdellovibrionaceae bacterium]
MKFFIDTADIEEIKLANKMGILDGVTTNPSLIAKTGRDHFEVITEICKEISGPVSAEVLSLDAEGIYKEGLELAKIADNVVIKVPMGESAMPAVKRFAADGIKTNVTLIFSAVQALLVAKAGATYVSPFVGRLDDIGNEGMLLIEQIRQIFTNYDFATEILVASIRSPQHILDSAIIGADVATVPLKVISQLSQHPLTDRGIEQFLKDAGAH